MRSLGWLAALALGCGGAIAPGADAGPILEPDASQARDAAMTDEDAGSSPADAGVVDGGLDGGLDGGPVSCLEDPCTSGDVCTGGPTCADAWTCSHDPFHACTDDVAPFCGCDGVTFYDSSTCPSRAFVRRGACEDPPRAHCDRRAVACPAVEPECPDGTYAEVVGSCWSGECVPIEACACDESDECPDPLIFVCYTAGHCGYPL